jgi:hypothetical protein
MSRILALGLIGCCVPTHSPAPPAGTRVPLDTLPARTLTLEEASADLWRPDLRPPWRAPTAAEATAIEDLVPELLRAASTRTIDPGAAAEAASVQLRIERWTVAGGEHLVLSEQPDARRGAGAYVFSLATPATASPWLLWEAPHAYHDLKTGTIAASLYFAPPPGSRPSAFFTNSIHRYTQTDGTRKKQKDNPADACHNPAHLLNVATQAAARAVAGATVVQLHGFAGDADDEGNRLPSGALAVVSAGDKAAPTPLSTTASARLRSILGTGVLLYPTEASALGATTNVEMRGLREVPGARFLHLETAAALRDLLVQDPSRRDAFGAAVFALATTPDEQLAR